MGLGFVFVPCVLRGAFVAVVTGVVAVCLTILRCFIDPDIVRDVFEVESSGAVGDPRWVVAPPRSCCCCCYHVSCIPCCYVCCCSGFSGWGVVTPSAMVAPSSSPVAVVIGASPLLSDVFGSVGY